MHCLESTMNHSPQPERRSFLAAALSTALGPLATGGVHAQASYPSKPIKVIVPFPAGGGADTLARLVLTRAAMELGQPVVIENVGGAGGNVGTGTAARAEPDGYTVAYGTNGTFAINGTLYMKPTFDPVKDFSPVSRLTQIGLVVVVRSGLPVGSFPDLVKMLKAGPGKFTVGSAGNGTTSHLAGELFKSQAGVAVVHIPYRGGAAAVTDLIGGQVDMMIEVMPNVVPHIKSGRLKALAVTTLRRASALPDVPTMAESGMAGFEVTAWDAIAVPVGTPPPVVAKLNAAIRVALTDPEIVRQLNARGAEPSPSSPEQLGQFIRSEIARWGAAVKRSGASVE